MHPTAVHAIEAVAAGETVPADELRVAAAVLLEAFEILHGGVVKATKEVDADGWALTRLMAYAIEARGLADDPLGMYGAAPDALPAFLARRAALSPADPAEI